MMVPSRPSIGSQTRPLLNIPNCHRQVCMVANGPSPKMQRRARNIVSTSSSTALTPCRNCRSPRSRELRGLANRCGFRIGCLLTLGDNSGMSLGTPALEQTAPLPTGTSLRRSRPLALWLERYGLALIIGAFVLLGFWYSMAIPAYETPDELYHYPFARHLAQGNPLPVQSAEATGPWNQEGSQAPLYYWIVGRLTAGIDQSDFEQLAITNPRANMGDPLFPGNKNRMLYSAAPQPLVGSNLALHIGRWFSLFLGAVTLWAVARTALLVMARRFAL